MSKICLYFVCLSLCVFALAGCRAEECAQMSQCCVQIQGEEGVGEACGPLAEQTTNPDSCRTVRETVVFMLEKKGRPVPAACK